MQYFNIQVASQLSGVASATIRAWEKRYHAVQPERGENKHRLYSEKDIEKLSILFKLTELGQSIGKIAHLEIEELKKIFSTLLHRPYDETQVITSRNVDVDKILNSFFIALSAYKLDIISHELEKAKNTLGPRDLCLKLLIPLFKEIGSKVSTGEINIAQEHSLSALFTFHIGQMIGLHYQKKPLKNDLILITTPEGEMHEIGIMASALLCVHYGIKFIFLGANLPAQSLLEAANALKPKVILLGVTKGHEISDHLTLGDYLNHLQNDLKNKTQIWVGGNLRSYVISDLQKNNISYFPTLEILDESLKHF